MLEPGAQVGRYEIQRRLGGGGMGTVYVGHDPVLGRLVGIKVFNSDLDIPDARERFAREARSAASLAHPNIVAVFDYGEFRGQPYIVMEYVPGDTLAEVIRQRSPVPLVDKLRWIEDLCSGAGFAHLRSVVHRDIKPANLIVDRSDRLRILDFGIARVLALASRTTGMMSGTPGYMAPEQILGTPVDQRADIFSIGAVFYELLAYTEAFPGETLPAISHRILSQEPTPIEQFLPGVGADLAPILDRALQKDPDDRFPDAESMRVAIARVRRQFESDANWTTPTMPAKPTATPPPAPRTRRPTGSEKVPSHRQIGVAELTPPPTRPRTDREMLARRRALQIETAVHAARQFLDIGDIDAALEKCHEALTLDENHAAALELEQDIHSAIDAESNQAESNHELQDLAPTQLSPRATPLPQQPHDAVPEATLIQPVEQQAGERMYEVAGVGPIEIEMARPAISEPTVIVPARATPAPASVSRRPLATPPPSAGIPAAKTTEHQVSDGVSAVAVVAPEAPPVSVRPASKPAAKESVRPSIGQHLQVILRRFAADVAAHRSAAMRGRNARTTYIVAAAVAVVVVMAAVGGAYLALRPAPTVATGILVIDAVPWANIKTIDRDGQRQSLPTPASTPLSLTVPVGTYHVVLAGPNGEPRQFDVRVEAGKFIATPVVPFAAPTPESYFEQYLASPQSATPGVADTDPSQTAASTGAPAATTSNAPATAAPVGVRP